MAKKKQDAGDVPGRALVDIPGVARCGEYVTLPKDAAEQLEAAGQFDPAAVPPAPTSD